MVDLDTVFPEGTDVRVNMVTPALFKRYPNAVALAVAKQEDVEDIIADFKQRSGTVYHPSCTCRMAPDAKTGVVDQRLRVYGVEGLRVIDASIMPRIITGNLNAPTIMMAEKLADVIRGRAPLPAIKVSVYVHNKHAHAKK